MEKGAPPHAKIEGCVVKMGIGLINTVNVKSVPSPQSVVEGVTIYVAVRTELFVCDRVPVMDAAGPPALPPKMAPDKEGLCQVYWVPAGIIPLVTFNAEKLKFAPLQVTLENEVTDTTGLTKTVTEKILPVQSPERGVTK